MSRLYLGVPFGIWLESPAWLPAGGAPGELLEDLRLDESELSVFLLPDGAEPQRVAVALAGKRSRLQDSGWIAFDLDIVQSLAIEIGETKGQTVDPVVDEWHRDLRRLTVNSVAAFVHRLWAIRESTLGNLASKEVKAGLVDGVKGGHLKLDLMHQEMQKMVKANLPS